MISKAQNIQLEENPKSLEKKKNYVLSCLTGPKFIPSRHTVLEVCPRGPVTHLNSKNEHVDIFPDYVRHRIMAPDWERCVFDWFIGEVLDYSFDFSLGKSEHFAHRTKRYTLTSSEKAFYMSLTDETFPPFVLAALMEPEYEASVFSYQLFKDSTLCKIAIEYIYDPVKAPHRKHRLILCRYHDSPTLCPITLLVV